MIVNGVGYDPWAPKLLAANPAAGRQVLTVGDLLGLKEGDNPHRVVQPGRRRRGGERDHRGAEPARPARRRLLRAPHAAFETQGLAQYHALIAAIRARYAGVPVGASESIFALLSPALGLQPDHAGVVHEGDQ